MSNKSKKAKYLESVWESRIKSGESKEKLKELDKYYREKFPKDWESKFKKPFKERLKDFFNRFKRIKKKSKEVDDDFNDLINQWVVGNRSITFNTPNPTHPITIKNPNPSQKPILGTPKPPTEANPKKLDPKTVAKLVVLGLGVFLVGHAVSKSMKTRRVRKQ